MASSHYLILQNSVCQCDCLFVWNRLQNHAHYCDEPFAGDSVGLGLGQRVNFIFKKLILRYFWGKIAPDEKILFTSRAGHMLISVMNRDYNQI